jgi:hypothetical protein
MDLFRIEKMLFFPSQENLLQRVSEDNIKKAETKKLMPSPPSLCQVFSLVL